MLSPTLRFDGKSKDYAAARPAYPAELMAWLAEKGVGEGTKIADIGAGTGKFTAQLIDLGAEVFAVEPNADMRTRLTERFGTHAQCHIVDATAESTALASASVELVTAAQAFHWFDAAAFARECARILVPGGKICLIWNLRVADAPVNAETEQISRAFCPSFNGFSANVTADDANTTAFFTGGCEKQIFSYDLSYSREGFVRRQLSSSYAPSADSPQGTAYADALGKLFDRLAQNDVLTVPNQTVAWWGRVSQN